MLQEKDQKIAMLEAQISQAGENTASAAKQMSPEEFMKMNQQVEKINAIKMRISDVSSNVEDVVLSTDADSNLMDAMEQGHSLLSTCMLRMIDGQEAA